MATVARSFRRAALSCSRQATPWKAPAACSCSVTRQTQRRKFSVTPVAFNQNGEGDAQTSSAVADGATKDAESDGTGSAPKKQVSDSEREFQSIRHQVKSIDREFTMDYITEPEAKQNPDIDSFYTPCRTFNDDGLPSMATDELEVHREIREYARIAAWDMPSLNSLAKPFVPPSTSQPLRFRYTTYLGEPHPAETKVVVEVCSKDLTPSHLTEAQRITLLKLVGPRYNPDLDLIHMSCENFPTRAQNKRYLGDMIDKLIEEAKTGDSFADVPLDLRHHKPKPKYIWPKEWNMTEKRKLELEAGRDKSQKLLGSVTVDGNMAIDEAVAKIPALSNVLAPKVGGGGSSSGKAKLGRPNHRQRGR